MPIWISLDFPIVTSASLFIEVNKMFFESLYGLDLVESGCGLHNPVPTCTIIKELLQFFGNA